MMCQVEYFDRSKIFVWRIKKPGACRAGVCMGSVHYVGGWVLIIQLVQQAVVVTHSAPPFGSPANPRSHLILMVITIYKGFAVVPGSGP